MKRKIFTISLLILSVAIAICMLSGCSRLDENVLTTDGNGSFTQKYSTIDKLQEDFTLSTASSVTDIATVYSMETVSNEETSQYNLSVNTEKAGYGYIAKKIKVTGGCYYAVDYRLKVTSIGEFNSGKGFDGVFASIIEDEDLNDSFRNAGEIRTQNNEIVDVEVVFRAKKSGYATVAIRFGTEEKPVNISALLNGFAVKRVNKATADESNYVGTFDSDYYGTVDTFNIFYIVMGAFAIAVICFIGYVMLRRHMAITDPENGKGYTGKFTSKLADNTTMNVLLIVGIGLVVRILTDVLSTVFSAGHAIGKTFVGYNVQGLATQALFIAKYGPQYLLQSAGGAFATDAGYTVMSVSSSPLQLYFLGFCGLFGRIFESSAPYFATMFFIRFFAGLADVGAALVLYSILKKYSGQIGATIVAATYLCLPVVFATSSLWGYTESITALLILLSVKFLLNNDYIGSASTYFCAFLFSQSALFFAPFILFYTILVCIRDVKIGEYKNLIAACAILVLSFFVYYAISVPFALNYIQNGKPFYWFGYAWNELYTGALYTINAFNFQAMLGNNLTEITTASLVVTIIFILFMLTLAGFAYFKNKNRMNLVLLATAFINMLFVFGNDMSPISMYISLILMLMYAVLNKEKRIFFSFAAFAVLTFINVCYYEVMLEFTATQAPFWTGKLPLMYVMSSFEIIIALFYVYVVYDIVVSRKVKKIIPLVYPFFTSVGIFFKRLQSNIFKKLNKLQQKN